MVYLNLNIALFFYKNMAIRLVSCLFKFLIFATLQCNVTRFFRNFSKMSYLKMLCQNRSTWSAMNLAIRLCFFSNMAAFLAFRSACCSTYFFALWANILAAAIFHWCSSWKSTLNHCISVKINNQSWKYVNWWYWSVNLKRKFWCLQFSQKPNSSL